MKHHPDRGKIEQKLLAEGHYQIVGIDEVGRGCLAGPIYAAAVVLDYDRLFKLPEIHLDLIRDSKKLSARQRQKIIPVIQDISKEFYICSSTVREIESLGIVDANFRAMRRTLRMLKEPASIVLLDGNCKIPRYTGMQSAIVGGDSLCFAIASASILAKEARDNYMREKASKYPQYNFASNVGYGTREHLDGIDTYGICPLHRKNFGPVSNYIEAHGQ